jgi:dimethylhistidine N-methyltransferase
MNSLVHFYDELDQRPDTIAEILDGLRQYPRSVSPKFFYDERGSELFTEITSLPEYYLTRTETQLLRDHAAEISELVGDDVMLIEYGSGSSEKIRILLEQLKPAIYAPLDISGEYLAQAAEALGREYPWLEVHATCIDFTGDFELPFDSHRRRVSFFPGSSIGNFERDAAASFLGRIRQLVGKDGGLLIGVDLKKDEMILNAAYNDSQGVTAAFNLNMLAHLNREHSADFNLEAFGHQAGYNAELGCIQMFLVSQQNQIVKIAGETFSFSADEAIHTENSHKYTVDEMSDMAQSSGFRVERIWQDSASFFAVFYMVGQSA